MSTYCETANETHAGLIGTTSAAMLSSVAPSPSRKWIDLRAGRRPAGIPVHVGPVRAKEMGRIAAALGRLADASVSLALLAILLPLLLVLGALVRLDSAGPALFAQQRLGLGGRPFTMFKFRSMRIDAEAGGPRWASVGDPRVTRIGRFLRATRLDELPQLFNVLKGDMALVGPRPERPHFTEQLTAVIPDFPSRLLVKPGITGWAQVNLPYGASIEDARAKLAYDLDYVQHRDANMTLRIVLRTVLVMLSRAGR